MGYKAGMTHLVRDVDKPGSKLHKKEAAEAVTIILASDPSLAALKKIAKNWSYTRKIGRSSAKKDVVEGLVGCVLSRAS